MIKHRYGSFSKDQMVQAKKKMRNQIFFLLLIVDPKTSGEYEDIDIPDAIENVLYSIGGLNDLLFCPKEIVMVLSLLNAAYIEYQKDDFKWGVYRKLILDAGNEVLKIKEVDDA